MKFLKILQFLSLKYKDSILFLQRRRNRRWFCIRVHEWKWRAQLFETIWSQNNLFWWYAWNESKSFYFTYIASNRCRFRRYRSGISVLLKKMKNRLGTVSPKTIMSDMQSSYFNGWIKIMGLVKHPLFCTWLVHEVWRKNLIQIKNKENKVNVTKMFYDLSTEIDFF